MKIIWSPLAIERVEEAGRYLAQDSLAIAIKWTEEIFAKVGRLRSFPKSGRIVPEIDSPFVREIIVGNYRVIYRIESRRILILTIRHTRQLLRMGEDEPEGYNQ